MKGDAAAVMESLRETDWRILIRLIENDACILLLGPGIAFDPQTHGEVSLSVKLAQTLAAQIGHTLTPACQDDLAHIAQIYWREKGQIALELAVEDFYQSYAGLTTDVHRQLATLPLSLCIDISHVDYMATALRALDKTPTLGFYRLQKEHPTTLLDTTPQRPMLYKLFGSLEEPDSLLLTENDLLDFLVSVAKNTPALPSDLVSRCSDPDVSLLFLGFGFQHWYLRILLHVLKAGGERKNNLSLALEDRAFFAHPCEHQTVLFYGQEHRMQFVHASWQAFADELGQRYAALVQGRATSAPAPKLPAEAPTLFLCHCSEDAEAVAAISRALERQGVGTWLDRQNLRGGDRWDQILHKAIEAWVDYFVVLESPKMLGRTESYYYQEIAAARERQRRFRQGAKFIFPAQLEACERLPELAAFQRTDLTQPEGVAQLAKAILDDWSRREHR